MNSSISVIVPAYNAVAHIERCIRSITTQTLHDIEILCIDDGSVDDTWQILDILARQDRRIRVLRHEKNLGLSEARNTGIRNAGGSYIASVDSDDYILPTMLERLWASTDGGTVDVVECGFQQVDPDGNVVSRYAPRDVFLDNLDREIDLFSSMKNAFWNKLWRKDLFTENGVWFPAGLHYQDLATTPRLLAHAKRMRIISDELYVYVLRENSTTSSYSAKHIMDYFRCFDVLIDFLQAENLAEKYQDKFLEFANSNLHYHAGNVLASNLSSADKEQYLRHMLMMKTGFFLRREELRTLHQDALLKLMLTNN
ncbi:glycosyl transferase, group 2 family protein [sediment metagenome]|uniref:Glycosyl transferase, group 2 family protein n=1 Tax=sediment metagenome TaxID=749907 RepID=D9PKT4_9ZZZZ